MDIDFPPKITCVRNFRNSLFKKKVSVRFFRMFLKLFSAIILGVRNFRVFEILEHLPYLLFWIYIVGSLFKRVLYGQVHEVFLIIAYAQTHQSLHCSHTQSTDVDEGWGIF